MTFAGGSGRPTNDPFWLPDEVSPKISFKDARGRTVSTPLITAGENTGVFLVMGQSLADSSVNAQFSPVNAAKIDQINLWDGGTYRAADPMVGPTRAGAAFGCQFLRVADSMITNGKFARIILVPCAVGGTSITNWAPGGDCSLRAGVAMKRILAAGTPAASVSAVLWQHGETDSANSMAQATYQSNFAAMLAAFRASYPNIPWFLAKSTWQGGGQNTAIRAAVDAIVAGGPLIYAGADTDTVNNGATDRYDGTHPTATGSGLMAALWVTALSAVF